MAEAGTGTEATHGSVGTSTKTAHNPEEKKIFIPVYPLVQFADIPESMQPDIVEMVTDCTERHVSDPEAASKAIKEKMDRNYNPNWHVVVGESFAFDVSYEPRSLLYMFNGHLAIAIWKSD